MYGRLGNTSKQETTMCLKSIKKQEKSDNNFFHVICGFLQGKDLITCKIFILQSSLLSKEYQLGNNHYFSRIRYAIAILIFQGH